jgi:hypothetical protein
MKTTSLLAQTARLRRNLRLIVERLEDRLVPGETLMGLLILPPGLSPLQGAVIDRVAPGDDTSALAVTENSTNTGNHQDAAFGVSTNDGLNDGDAWLLSDWQPAKAEPAGGGGGAGASASPANGGTAANDQVFAGSTPTADFTSNGLMSIFGSALATSPSSGSSVAAIGTSGHALGSDPSPSPYTPSPLTSSSDLAAPVTRAISQDSGAAAESASGTGAGYAEPNLLVRPTGAKPAATSFGGYSPAQIKGAYGVNLLSQTGSGVKIAIVDAFDDPSVLTDLNSFSSRFGLPQMVSGQNFIEVQPQGKPRGNTGWAQEISLDVQWAHAMAPGATIVLEEAKTNSFSNLYGAVDDAVATQHAQVVSMSWSGGESSGETANDSHFNVPGVTFLASSGDTGGAVGYPSTSPYVISAGGTSLPFDSNGNPVPSAETAWSSGGGGPSTVESEPGYQTSYGITITGGKRGTPDISSDADPNTGVLVNYRGNYYIFGGTSVSAPTLAGIVALADQSRATPLSSNNLTSRTEYNAATGALYASNYRDITTGSNGHPATTGYDLATGLGSPLANTLVPWMNANS